MDATDGYGEDHWGGEAAPLPPTREDRMASDAAEELCARYGPVEHWSFAVTRETLPEALLDAVFSVRMRHGAVDDAVHRFRTWAAGREDGTRTAADLVAALQELPDGVLPRNRCAGRAKTDIAADSAARLAAIGVGDVDSFRDAVLERPAEVEETWRSVKGLGEQSWAHVRMLAGCPWALPGPRVRRWLGGARRVGGEMARDIVHRTALRLGTAPVVAEYAMTMDAAYPVPAVFLADRYPHAGVRGDAEEPPFGGGRPAAYADEECGRYDDEAYGPYDDEPRGPYDDVPRGPYDDVPRGPYDGEPCGSYDGESRGPYDDEPRGPYGEEPRPPFGGGPSWTGGSSFDRVF
ncbi:hypothetical protein [Corynebacterium sp. 335C]